MIIQLTIGSILFLFPVKEAEANGTTYYVDSSITDTNVGSATPDFTTYNPTTFETTGGSASVYKTIADINACSFSAGDSILLRKGQTWREQLTVPSSGSAGSPITFGAYGTGDDPIINGADVIGTWTNLTGSLLDDNFDDNDITDWTTITGTVIAQNQRVECTISNGGEDSIFRGTLVGNYAYFRTQLLSTGLTWSTTNNIYPGGLNKFSGTRVLHIGINNSGGTPKWFAIYLNDAGEQTVSSVVTVTLDAWHEVYLYYKPATGAGLNDGIVQAFVDGVAIVNLSNVDSDTRTLTGMKLGNASSTAGVSGTVYIDDAKLSATPAGLNLWKATLTTEPFAVWFDGTFGEKKTSIGTLSTVNDWFWESNVLYCYSTSDPDTAYTAPGIESSSRKTALIDTQDYITLDNITFSKGGNADNGDISIGLRQAKNIVVQDCEILDSVNLGIDIYDPSGITTGDTLIQRCTFRRTGLSKSTSGAPSGIQTYNTPASSTLTVQNCTFQDMDIYGDHHGHGMYIQTGKAVIRYNIFYGDAASAGSGVRISSITACEVYYNLFTERDSSNAHAYRYWGMAINGSTGRHLIYNNVFNGCIYAINSTSDDPSYTLKNNIFYSHGGSGFQEFLNIVNGSVNLISDNNCFYVASGDPSWTFGVNTYTTFATWKTGSSQDASSVYADPLFTDSATNDFTLLPASPCINVGTNVGLTTDYAGNAVPRCSIVDIGAYENQTKACPVTTGGGSPPGYSNPPVPGPNGFRCIINNNDASTNNREVNLTLEAGSNVKYVGLSEKPDLSGAGFEPFEPEISFKKFMLSMGDGLKRVYAQFLTQYNRFSDIIYDEIVLDTSSSAKQEEQPKPPEQAKPNENPETAAIVDGDLIRVINGFDVYIVKLIGEKKFKRLILNPDIFNQYGHLKWENVKEVSQEILDQYIASDLVRALGDIKVHKLYTNGDIGEKRWSKTLEDFLSFAYDWDSVYTINNYERNSYATGIDLTSRQ